MKLSMGFSAMARLGRRGIRVLAAETTASPGRPAATYARVLEHFVNLFGYTEMKTIIAATALGGELFQKPN